MQGKVDVVNGNDDDDDDDTCICYNKLSKANKWAIVVKGIFTLMSYFHKTFIFGIHTDM